MAWQVRAVTARAKNLSLVFSTYMGGLVTTVPEDLVPAFDLCWLQVHTW